MFIEEEQKIKTKNARTENITYFHPSLSITQQKFFQPKMNLTFFPTHFGMGEFFFFIGWGTTRVENESARVKIFLCTLKTALTWDYLPDITWDAKIVL